MSTDVGKIVVAVSGGVDSVALLHMLGNGALSGFKGSEIIVAHVNHGIRGDSEEDARLVEGMAKKYGLKFELYEAKLGEDTSEADAREARYKFLLRVCRKHHAQAIITAHHQDDLVETAIANLLRGTSWRGLASLRPKSAIESDGKKIELLRPLLAKPKGELVQYAKANKINWREDSSNANQDYLRNYIRKTLVPIAKNIDKDFNKKMLKQIEGNIELRREIESEIEALAEQFKLNNNEFKVPRYQLIMWPSNVSSEVMYHILRVIKPDWHPESSQIHKTLLFSKTALPGKQLQISSGIKIEGDKHSITFSAKS